MVQQHVVHVVHVVPDTLTWMLGCTLPLSPEPYTDLHDALHVAPDLSCVQVALGVAHHVQTLYGVLPSVLG